MVNHDIRVQGIGLTGVPQARPALLQLNNEDFPGRFLTSLGALSPAPASGISALPTSPGTPVTLYQPVQRVLHLALLDLTCDTVGFPRLDPTRVESGGMVIRRIVRTKGVDDLGAPPSAWMKSADGQFQWRAMTAATELLDPDPSKRPSIYSGQPALDALLAEQALTMAKTEVFTPAFVAPPTACDAAGHTLVYGVIPTASSEVTATPPSAPQYDAGTLADGLPTLLKAGPHAAPFADQHVNFRYMSDEFARSNGATAFLPFSMALRLLYTVAGAFQNTPEAKALVAELDRHRVYYPHTVNGKATLTPQPMGAFYQTAAAALLDYDPNGGSPVPLVVMPRAWDTFSDGDGAKIVALIAASLQRRISIVASPVGRFQDPSRLYRLRVFFRVKGNSPQCPAELVWSKASDPFRIAPWHESAGRSVAPVPLPDPADRNFLKNARPNCAFTVPASLMNAMSGSTLSGLSDGTPPAKSSLQLDWICGFNIPLITICAFFVLNIFLTLLNIVFFWLPFIKICIPFPAASSAGSGDTDGT